MNVVTGEERILGNHKGREWMPAHISILPPSIQSRQELERKPNCRRKLDLILLARRIDIIAKENIEPPGLTLRNRMSCPSGAGGGRPPAFFDGFGFFGSFSYPAGFFRCRNAAFILFMHSERKTLSENLTALVEGPGETLTVRAVVERVGDKGFGLLLLLLSLPSALPVPAPGYSTPFGILLILLGAQMAASRPRPWLPEKALRKEFSREKASGIFRGASRFLHIIEKLIRPRMRWINLRGGRIFLGVIVMFMSGLMILPIPFTNTFPAFVIFLVGAALSEDDGLVALAAFFLGLLALAFYGYIIFLLATVGMEGVVQLKEWIKSQF